MEVEEKTNKTISNKEIVELTIITSLILILTMIGVLCYFTIFNNNINLSTSIILSSNETYTYNNNVCNVMTSIDKFDTELNNCIEVFPKENINYINISFYINSYLIKYQAKYNKEIYDEKVYVNNQLIHLENSQISKITNIYNLENSYLIIEDNLKELDTKLFILKLDDLEEYLLEDMPNIVIEDVSINGVIFSSYTELGTNYSCKQFEYIDFDSVLWNTNTITSNNDKISIRNINKTNVKDVCF